MDMMNMQKKIDHMLLGNRNFETSVDNKYRQLQDITNVGQLLYSRQQNHSNTHSNTHENVSPILSPIQFP